MAMPAPAPTPVTALAEKIYLELVCRGVVITENAAQIKANPENLAKISIKLAEAFLRVVSADRLASAPKTQEFDMKATDLSVWNAPKG
jgi:hypothetical protein